MRNEIHCAMCEFIVHTRYTVVSHQMKSRKQHQRCSFYGSRRKFSLIPPTCSLRESLVSSPLPLSSVTEHLIQTPKSTGNVQSRHPRSVLYYTQNKTPITLNNLHLTKVKESKMSASYSSKSTAFQHQIFRNHRIPVDFPPDVERKVASAGESGGQ